MACTRSMPQSRFTINEEGKDEEEVHGIHKTNQ
jgi:hypothetical protein